MILATTTSTQDSGLLDVLVPMFERRSRSTVKTVAVGTGQALTMGERGEADVVLVHAPKVELDYAARGTLVNRRLVMHNDFVLVGPLDDPAGVRSAKTATEAFRTIAGRRAPFVSRGDNSGTHAKEKSLWRAAGVEARGGWYLESGDELAGLLEPIETSRTIAGSASKLYRIPGERVWPAGGDRAARRCRPTPGAVRRADCLVATQTSFKDRSGRRITASSGR